MNQIIIVHHSASSPNTTIATLEMWHRDRDFTLSKLGYHIGYHYVILADGMVVQTRYDTEIGCHTVPNTGKLGICLVGNFELAKPTPAQLDSLDALLVRKTQEMGITLAQVYGHRDYAQTACPGYHLYDWLQKRKKISWLEQQIANLMAQLRAKQPERYVD